MMMMKRVLLGTDMVQSHIVVTLTIRLAGVDGPWLR